MSGRSSDSLTCASSVGLQIRWSGPTLDCKRVLMLNISDEMTSEELDSLIFLLRDYVGHGRLAKTKTFLAVAIELEKVNLLAPHKMDLLEKCLKNIHRVDLTKKIQKYKEAGRRVSSLSSPQVASERSGEQKNKPLSVTGTSKSPQRVYVNALKAFPNLNLVDPKHSFEIRSSEMLQQANGAIPCQGAEKIHLSVQESGTSVHQGLDDCYTMQSHPLGMCLIIDCIGNDTEVLRQTFTALHFEVQFCVYVTLDDLIRTVRDMAVTPRHRDYDCFVCVIVSRGSAQEVFGTDKSSHGFLLNNIRNMFTGALCPGLLGKPKLFFIQNYLVVGGSEYSDSLVEVDGNEHGVLAEDGRWHSSGIPNEADIFWSHCKVDSSVLETSHSAPSFYLLCLSQLLREHRARRLHLLDIHTELNRRVYERNTNSDPREHYSLLLQHTLRKKLFLTCN
ncbi:CASP8 and FADD-like apoptosis regulator isoform X2 [Pleurodeles waltl]|uniref:CASP8 and FADD-like apoptosis regulator isoform X2 n=1 Tax=Pleurodeles waltl TaxID=8319 RepID=UPI003709430D